MTDSHVLNAEADLRGGRSDSQQVIFNLYHLSLMPRTVGHRAEVVTMSRSCVPNSCLYLRFLLQSVARVLLFLGRMGFAIILALSISHSKEKQHHFPLACTMVWELEASPPYSVPEFAAETFWKHLISGSHCLVG